MNEKREKHAQQYLPLLVVHLTCGNSAKIVIDGNKSKRTKRVGLFAVFFRHFSQVMFIWPESIQWKLIYLRNLNFVRFLIRFNVINSSTNRSSSHCAAFNCSSGAMETKEMKNKEELVRSAHISELLTFFLSERSSTHLFVWREK